MIKFISSTDYTASTGAPAISVPTSIAGDFLLLSVHSANEAVATPSGWTDVGVTYSTGTAGAAGGTRLSQFWKIQSGSDTTVTVADSGSTTGGAITAWRGVNNTNPIASIQGGVEASATTSLTLPAVTVGEDQLVLWSMAIDADANSTANVTNITHGSLTSITELVDRTTNAGAGGGISVWYSPNILAPQTVSAATATVSNGIYTYSTIALRPAIISLSGAASVANTASANLLNGIRFATNALVSLTADPGLTIPVITLNAIANLSYSLTASINTAIRLASSSNVNVSGGANVSTNIRLASAPVTAIGSTGNITTSIRLGTTAPIVVSVLPDLKSYAAFQSAASVNITSNTSLYKYPTFGTSALISATSQGSITTSIRLSSVFNLTVNAASPKLGSAQLLASSASLGISAYTFKLGNQSLFDAAASISTSGSGTMRIGVLFYSSATLNIGSTGYVIPDFTPSNIVFDSVKSTVFDLSTKYAAFDSAAVSYRFTWQRELKLTGSNPTTILDGGHVYSWNTPILRLEI